jgi:carboxypeptidase Taq
VDPWVYQELSETFVLDEAMRKDMPDRDSQLQQGETESILKWLREQIHVKGKLHSAEDLITSASGKPASTKPLISYLEEKYSKLYEL